MIAARASHGVILASADVHLVSVASTHTGEVQIAGRPESMRALANAILRALPCTVEGCTLPGHGREERGVAPPANPSVVEQALGIESNGNEGVPHLFLQRLDGDAPSQSEGFRHSTRKQGVHSA